MPLKLFTNRLILGMTLITPLLLSGCSGRGQNTQGTSTNERPRSKLRGIQEVTSP
jgi:hypothetical protein